MLARPTSVALARFIGFLLPMAFVTGLMGPYMSPIPINARTQVKNNIVLERELIEERTNLENAINPPPPAPEG